MNARQLKVLEFLKSTDRHSELHKASSVDATEGREFFVAYAPCQCSWLSTSEVTELVDGGYLVKVADWKYRLARIRQSTSDDDPGEPTPRWLVWKDGKYTYNRPRAPEHAEGQA